MYEGKRSAAGSGSSGASSQSIRPSRCSPPDRLPPSARKTRWYVIRKRPANSARVLDGSAPIRRRGMGGSAVECACDRSWCTDETVVHGPIGGWACCRSRRLADVRCRASSRVVDEASGRARGNGPIGSRCDAPACLPELWGRTHVQEAYSGFPGYYKTSDGRYKRGRYVWGWPHAITMSPARLSPAAGGNLARIPTSPNARCSDHGRDQGRRACGVRC